MAPNKESERTRSEPSFSSGPRTAALAARFRRCSANHEAGAESEQQANIAEDADVGRCSSSAYEAHAHRARQVTGSHPDGRRDAT